MANAQLQIGQFNVLTVVEKVDFGVYLDGGDAGDILLPKLEVPEDCETGDTIEVFIYFDSEDRLIATRETPLTQVGEFAVLKVVANERVGAFLDWGLPKDLFLPFGEQTRPLKLGQDVVVFVEIDKSGRIAATMRIASHIDKSSGSLKDGDEIDLIIAARTDLGYKAIVNGRHSGVLYKDEVFRELHYGERTRGFVKKIRPDGKIDLILQDPKQVGHRAADDVAPKILELLKSNGGFAPITDKTPAEEIYRLFGVSKKKYKIALGGLYKKRLIKVEEDGIRLV